MSGAHVHGTAAASPGVRRVSSHNTHSHFTETSSHAGGQAQPPLFNRDSSVHLSSFLSKSLSPVRCVWCGEPVGRTGTRAGALCVAHSQPTGVSRLPQPSASASPVQEQMAQQRGQMAAEPQCPGAEARCPDRSAIIKTPRPQCEPSAGVGVANVGSDPPQDAHFPRRSVDKPVAAVKRACPQRGARGGGEAPGPSHLCAAHRQGPRRGRLHSTPPWTTEPCLSEAGAGLFTVRCDKDNVASRARGSGLLAALFKECGFPKLGAPRLGRGPLWTWPLAMQPLWAAVGTPRGASSSHSGRALSLEVPSLTRETSTPGSTWQAKL